MEFHHELNNSHTERQNKWITSLIKVFNDNGLLFDEDKDVHWRNIITGQIFKDDVYYSMLNSEKTGWKLYEEFVSERPTCQLENVLYYKQEKNIESS